MPYLEPLAHFQGAVKTLSAMRLDVGSYEQAGSRIFERLHKIDIEDVQEDPESKEPSGSKAHRERNGRKGPPETRRINEGIVVILPRVPPSICLPSL